MKAAASGARRLPAASVRIVDPASHIQALHAGAPHHRVTIASSGEGWAERTYSVPAAIEVASAMEGQVDAYISYQTFFGHRCIANLASLAGAYVDLDYHKTERWAPHCPDTVALAVLQLIKDDALPPPSFIMSTGRGLLVVWLHDRVPAGAQTKWNAIQRHLAKALVDFGADMGALDAARVFRLVGTRNSKSGAIVRLVQSNWTASGYLRWDFDDLAFECLPLRREELAELRQQRAQRRLSRPRPGQTEKLSRASYGRAIQTDLQRLRELRWGGRLPPGQRDIWLFFFAAATSWTESASSLQERITSYGREYADWSRAEVNSRLSSVFRRADDAAAKRPYHYDGRQCDPRYCPSAAYMVNALSITPDEMRAANLGVLVDRDRRRQLATERHIASRRKRGVRCRAEYELAGRSRALEAGALRAEGLSWPAVAERMGFPSADAARKAAGRAASEGDRTSDPRYMVACPTQAAPIPVLSLGEQVASDRSEAECTGARASTGDVLPDAASNTGPPVASAEAHGSNAVAKLRRAPSPASSRPLRRVGQPTASEPASERSTDASTCNPTSRIVAWPGRHIRPAGAFRAADRPQRHTSHIDMALPNHGAARAQGPPDPEASACP